MRNGWADSIRAEAETVGLSEHDADGSNVASGHVAGTGKRLGKQAVPRASSKGTCLIELHSLPALIQWCLRLSAPSVSLRRLARPALPLAVRLRQHRRQKLAGEVAGRLVVHVPNFGGSASALDPPPLPEFPFCADRLRLSNVLGTSRSAKPAMNPQTMDLA